MTVVGVAIIIVLLIVNIWLVLRHNAAVALMKYNHRFSLLRVSGYVALLTSSNSYRKLTDIIEDEIDKV